MLKFMRKKKRSIVVWIIFSAIIAVFIFWGVGNFRIDKSGVVARVNSKVISAQEFTKAYQRQIDYYKKSIQGEISDEILEKLNLKQMTIEGLINRAILLEEAQKQNIKIKKEELQKTIQTIPAFQKNGIFDKEIYFKILSGMRMQPGEFEKAIEEEMMIERVQQKIVGSIDMSDSELMAEFKKENKRINLQYAIINSSPFEKGAAITDDEIKSYFEKNKDNFKMPDRIKIDYIASFVSDIKPKIKVSEDDVQSYYEKNIKAFERHKEVRARHILFRLQDGKDAAKKKAEDVLSLIKKGENFGELAKKYSNDPGSAKNGGDLGYFKSGMMVKSFEDAAFALKKGEVSGIIETEFGFHIIKAEDIQEAGLKPFNEVRREVTELLKTSHAIEKAKGLAEDIRKDIDSGKDLKDASASKGVRLKQTNYFSPGDRGEEIAMNDYINKTIFSLKKGETSHVLDGKDGYYIVRIVDKQESRFLTLEEALPDIKNILIKQKAVEKAKTKAQEFLREITLGKEDFVKKAQKDGYKTDETGMFGLEDGIIPKIIVNAAPDLFELTNNAPYYSKPVSSHGNTYVLKLKEVVEADAKGFEAKKEDIKNRLIGRKKQETFGKWLTDTRTKAKIQINKDAM
ncbi:MAG: SurA N-terminal domain-containing protein [Deltaproteobacteria bacterium]|nr:SurA N-terminal domain-containing protein [Deltaproteobacteria bacterium]